MSQYTSDTTGSSWESYSSPSLTRLTGNRVLLCWSRGSNSDVYYSVLDSIGNVVKADTNLSLDGSVYERSPDAVFVFKSAFVFALGFCSTSFSRVQNPTAAKIIKTGMAIRL